MKDNPITDFVNNGLVIRYDSCVTTVLSFLEPFDIVKIPNSSVDKLLNT